MIDLTQSYFRICTIITISDEIEVLELNLTRDSACALPKLPIHRSVVIRVDLSENRECGVITRVVR